MTSSAGASAPAEDILVRVARFLVFGNAPRVEGWRSRAAEMVKVLATLVVAVWWLGIVSLMAGLECGVVDAQRREVTTLFGGWSMWATGGTLFAFGLVEELVFRWPVSDSIRGTRRQVTWLAVALPFLLLNACVPWYAAVPGAPHRMAALVLVSLLYVACVVARGWIGAQRILDVAVVHLGTLCWALFHIPAAPPELETFAVLMLYVTWGWAYAFLARRCGLSATVALHFGWNAVIAFFLLH